MAGFKTHFNVTLISTGILVFNFYQFNLFPDNQLLFPAILLSIFSGMAPDLDSDSSKILLIFFDGISLLFCILGVAFLCCYELNYYQLAGIGIGLFILFRYGVITLFMMLTSHRGIFHSVPIAFLIGIIIATIGSQIFNMANSTAWAFGFLFTFNYLLHLLLDEIASLNLIGIKTKKSLGTAFKFFSFKNPIQYLVVYIILISAISLSPEYQSFIDSFVFNYSYYQQALC